MAEDIAKKEGRVSQAEKLSAKISLHDREPFRPVLWKLSDSEFESFWSNCHFVFDTNVPLHFYRYSEATLDRFKAILSAFRERVFVPYQVWHELHANRIDRIDSAFKPFQALNERLKHWKKEYFMEIESEHAYAAPGIREEILASISRLEILVAQNSRGGTAPFRMT